MNSRIATSIAVSMKMMGIAFLMGAALIPVAASAEASPQAPHAAMTKFAASKPSRQLELAPAPGVCYEDVTEGAIADCTAEIKRTAAKDLDRPYNARGWVYYNTGDFDHALADYNEAIRRNARTPDAWGNRAMIELYRDDLAKALADMSQAAEISPEDPTTALWLDIIGDRNGIRSSLARRSEKFDMTKWPGPIVKLYMGDLTPAAVLAAADQSEVNVRTLHTCQANFYIGMLKLRAGAKTDAAKYLREAVSKCRPADIEHHASVLELQRIEPKR